MSKTGLDWKLYRNTGTHETPVWTPIGRASNVNCPLTKTMAAVPRKESRWNRSIGSLKDGPLEFDYVYKHGADANHVALLHSFVNDAPIQLAVVDGDIEAAGAFGFKAWYEVSDYPLNQPLTDGVVLAVKCALADHEEEDDLCEPEFIGVSSSSSPEA